MKNIIQAGRASAAVKCAAATLVSVALIAQTSLPRPSSATSHTPIDRNSLAAEYAKALREVGSVGSMSIRSEQDVRKATATINAVRAKLRKGRFSYLAVTLANNSAFKQALTSRLRAEEAKPQNASLSRLAIGKSFYRTHIGLNKIGFVNSELGKQGAAALRLQAKTDAGIFQRAGKNLKDSLAKLKAANHLEVERARSPLAFGEFAHAAYRPRSSMPNDMVDAADVAPLQGGLLEAAIIAGAIILISAYFTAKAEDITEEDNPDPEGGQRTDFERCMDEADAKLNTCRDKCKKDDWFCEGLCSAEWYFSMGICVALPQ